MHHELIIAGFGGQGIMFAGQLLTYTGMMEDRHVSYIPSYGPEMRGGTANCSVVISEKEIGSPIVTDPGILVTLNQPAFDKFAPTVKDGGLIIYNSTLINGELPGEDVETLAVPASKIADELGNPRITNMVMLGALIKKTQMVSLETILDSLEKVLPEHRHNLIPLNKQALEAGMEYTEDKL
ncbi:MAG: 2-oxoacid:ferredoxin oxidoreductase subunit gamma [Clostridia bacterium]|nr:2-oxoacid:ferredoxin oxidoreductase subunit gamma [Clostridia bacterium]